MSVALAVRGQAAPRSIVEAARAESHRYVVRVVMPHDLHGAVAVGKTNLIARKYGYDERRRLQYEVRDGRSGESRSSARCRPPRRARHTSDGFVAAASRSATR